MKTHDEGIDKALEFLRLQYKDPTTDNERKGYLAFLGKEIAKLKIGTPKNLEQAETIFKAYPSIVGKKPALKKIQAALLDVPFDELLEITKAYAAAVAKWPSREFVPHAATWFHQERYKDPRETWEHKGPPPKTPAEIIQIDDPRNPHERIRIAQRAQRRAEYLAQIQKHISEVL